MIKYIFQIGDIHIKNLRRLSEYKEQLSKFIKQVEDFIEEKKLTIDEVRIVVTGDLLHNKLDISGEGYLLAHWFLSKLDNICKTIVIAGNHDINMLNKSRVDPITTIFKMSNFKLTHYLDYETSFKSACIEDDNIIWCLFSIFDNFSKPNIKETRLNYKDKTYVGLFHGEIKNSVTNTGFVSENGYESSYFSGIDFGLLGHIHKRQEIQYDGIKLLYCGSLIQQNHGENISGHGYSIWDVEKQTHKDIDLENNDNGFYTFVLNGDTDISENKEEIINL